MQTILNSYLHYPTNYYCIVGLRVASSFVTSEADMRLRTHHHSQIRVRILFWNWYQVQLITHPLQEAIAKAPCRNVSTTPLRQWGFRQCLPFCWTTLRDKHCWHPIAVMGVVDTFGLSLMYLGILLINPIEFLGI